MSTTNPTPEQLRAAIAEACPGVIQHWLGQWQYYDGYGWRPCKDNDPLADLNAMHEAEKVRIYTDHNTYVRFETILIEMVEHPLHATATQRAEAFCRVVKPELFQ